MTRLPVVVGFSLLLLAVARPAEAQRGDPAENTRTDAIVADLSCAIKGFAKNPDGSESQILDKGATVWPSFMPPRVYALIFLYNAGPRSQTVHAYAMLHEIAEKDGRAYQVGLKPFVSSSGVQLNGGSFTVSEAVAAHGTKILGSFWINSERLTTKFPDAFVRRR